MHTARELVDKVMAAFVAGDGEALDDLMSSDYIQHNDLNDGIDGVKRFSARLHRSFPDMTVEIHDVVTEGDRVVARLTMEGTHEGPFLGVAPTGRRIRFDSIDIWRIRDGRFVEHWDSVDQVGVMKQLGLLPTKG